MDRIHILGASGSGTSTLAGAMAHELGFHHMDTDAYFWAPSDPPFTVKREPEERIRLMREEMKIHSKWVLSGSLCGWGDVFTPDFQLVVYLHIPPQVRMRRLMEREIQRYGDEIKPGGRAHEQHKVFLAWASQYDEGGMEVRSRVLHESWLAELTCPVLRLEGDLTVRERLDAVIKRLGA